MGYILIHIVPSICTGFFAQLILHETGHLFFGCVTGWKFLFLQVHRIVIKKADSKLRLILVNDKNYKCIMSPKSVDSDALLYTMGGCIVNMVSGLVGFLLITHINIKPVLWLYIWSFSAFGAGLFIMNGTARIKRVCNDKACYDLLKENIHTRICHNAQLMAATYLAKGLTYGQIDKEFLCMDSKTAGNDIEAYQAVLEYYYYLDTGNYSRAGQALDKVKPTVNVSKEIKDIIEAERIYIKIVLSIKFNNDGDINYNFSGGINELIKKGDVHFTRIMTAMKAYIEYKAGNINNALDVLNESINMTEKTLYVYEGEKVFCMRQLEDMKSILENELQNSVYK